jgi:hypothetical protein
MPKVTTEKKPLHKKIIQFVEAVQAISPTDPEWKGVGVKVNRMDMTATDSQRTLVDSIGQNHGCHSCLTKVKSDKNQPWIGDHQPPTELNATARVLAQRELEECLRGVSRLQGL